MPLESATYLDGLVVSNPAASDAVGQADDHIRMIKAVLKNTFPNINSACSATPLQMNQGFVPIGAIVMWSGSTASLPTGWKLCDGGTYAKSDGSGNITVPDLRNKFILGCGGSDLTPATAPTVGTTGGSHAVTPSIAIAATALTKAQLPSYNLTVTDPGHTHVATVTDPGHTHKYYYGSPMFTDNWGGYAGNIENPKQQTSTDTATTGITVANASATTGITVNSGGSGEAHTHTVTTAEFDNRPEFYTLAFIIKI